MIYSLLQSHGRFEECVGFAQEKVKEYARNF